MGIVAVVHEIVQILVKHLRIHLPVVVGQRDNLMLCELHRSSLMHIDVARVYTNHALILIEQ